MKIAVAILSLNEKPGLEAVFAKIPRPSVSEVFAVDGGSTDGTLEFYQQHRVRVLGQSRKGRGEAMRLGFRESDAEAIIFFSPDGNENPEDIARFVPYLQEGYDLVIASRMMKGAVNEEDGQVFKWRKWANLGFDWAANALWNKTGIPVTDCINGFRGITREAFERLAVDETGFTIEYQMTIRALKHRLRIIEFPTHEGPRIGRESGAAAIPTGLKFLRCLGRELGR
jgi:glycosyltransferase involved in cell wall biosynthesis